MKTNKFEPIIGLEIHVELKTASKMFCGCINDPFGASAPNVYTCPVCLGLPGALPVPNRKAVEWCVLLGLALNCQIPEFSKFDRKNYFYPDLPKGYQISQYDKPFCINGSLKLKTKNSKVKTTTQNSKLNDEKVVRIRRVHLEEDTGKLIHATVEGKKCTLIDFNRSGVPLVEIVTEPDIRSSEEARIFLKKLHQIIRYLGISDADMEKGSMRLEPNVSVNKSTPGESLRNTPGVTGTGSPGVDSLPPYKVEVKNINSFNFAKKAIDYEITRQMDLLMEGKTPKQETRGWDEKRGITYSQRGKEEAHDYRYFPEPDIPPVHWTGNQISRPKADQPLAENFKFQIPELPDAKIERFMREYSLSEYDGTILTESLEVADYFEKTLRHLGGGLLALSEVEWDSPDGGGARITPKIIANWIINKRIEISKTTPEELLKMISQKQQVGKVGEKELKTIIKKVVINNPKAVSDYKSGKQQALMFLVGQVMRELKGKGDANSVRKNLEKEIK